MAGKNATEVRINKEIRDYSESMFFGLSMRQFFFSCLACGSAVGSYFLLRELLGTEITSWVCILTAVPFAVLGFVKYNGMPAEQFIKAYIKSKLLSHRKLTMSNTNMYWHLMKKNRKELMDVKDTENYVE